MSEDKRRIVEDVRFVSTYEFFKREKSGKKPYTIRDINRMASSKYDRALRFIRGETILTVTISKAYTRRAIRHTVTDITAWHDGLVFAWNPNERSLI